MLQALGARMFDRRGREISAPITGAALGRITHIDLDATKINPDCEIIIASDVRNPLVGAHAATAVFGPQKGATLAMRKTLEQSLKRYGRILERLSGHKLLGLPGAGAGGGIVASLIAVGDQLRSGAMLVAESIGLPAAIRDADLVITGEGRIDAQTLSGKVVDCVGELARKFNVPVIAA